MEISDSKKKIFIEKSEKKHGDKYDYSKVNYIDAKTKVIIICYIHGQFELTPNKHLSRGDGCKKCGREQCAIKQRSTTDYFKQNAQLIHVDKNNNPIYIYEKTIYVDSKTKVIITCRIHGDFQQIPHNHLSGNGCVKCRNDNSGSSQRLTNEEFIQQSILVHMDETGIPIYGYDYVKYINSHDDVIITCRKHGNFNQRPNNHLNGATCPHCNNEKSSERQRKPIEEFIQQSKEIHGDKNDYSQTIYGENSNTLVDIICNLHGLFKQSPSNHLAGKEGCVKCHKHGYSIKAILWLNFISKMENINIQHAENGSEFIIPTTKMRADGYCKETNTIYEFHGDFWHGNPNKYNSNDISGVCGIPFGELYKKTLEKENLIKELGYNLIVIWESDWDKICKNIKNTTTL